MSKSSVRIDRFNRARPCRVVVLTNPKAGSGASRDQVPRLVRLLEDSEIDCAVSHTIDDLQHQLGGSRQSHDTVVVACGGDGTVSLAASVISSQGTDGDPGAAIVPMPLGTENLLARQFGHTSDAELVIQTIRHGASYPLDVGMAGDRPFLIMATCGFDADVVRRMHFSRRGHIRRLSYLGPILAALRQYSFPEIHIRIDNSEPRKCRWAMVFNLPCYAAGLGIEPEAVGDDGLLDVITFKRGSVAAGLKYLSWIWFGRHLNAKDVDRRRGRSIEITSDERVPFQLDGDYAGRLPLRIETVPAGVQLLLPPSQ